MDKEVLLQKVKNDDVKFISLQFTDVFGSVKSVDMPTSQLERIVDSKGIWFDGSSVEGFTRIQESDMHLRPEWDTYRVLPWTPSDMKRARIICDVEDPSGKPFDCDPRGVLKRAIDNLHERGMEYFVGPEPEFFLFRQQNGDKVQPVPFDTGHYFDFSADDAAVRIRSKLIIALQEMGLDVEVGHHECGLGQHEIDFKYDNAIQTADNILAMKFTVKAIANQEGIIASFMPKPSLGQAGSGMHCHQSLWTLDGKTNLFADFDKEFNLSDMARWFIGGQLKHARGLAGIVAPTVNSYKRLVPGYEAPTYIGWAQTNRSAMIRIPRSDTGPSAVRAEFRCPDPSCNPYLALTAMLAAGLDGIDNHIEPMPAWKNLNVFELSRHERKEMGIVELPGSLKEALIALEEDELIRNAIGENLFESYIRGKWNEWDNFKVAVSDWEINRYLETI